MSFSSFHVRTTVRSIGFSFLEKLICYMEVVLSLFHEFLAISIYRICEAIILVCVVLGWVGKVGVGKYVDPFP